ncbi:unnamed protein product [Arctia plantaginis]|uniref:Major facilitator superfamily (MFS) profile domain-containing protein n=1 Tax=Arctia plantaginis TaxID=874455 RepID=A0A8S1BAB2_ARCPL|nr:unnamed protein product [Arctia plantaginis]
MFAQGIMLSYPTSLLPALNQPDSPIKTDLNTSSWLGSILAVSSIPGFLLSSVFMDLYGRKMTHAVAILPGIAGWLLIYFAEDVKTLMIGRFLGGLTSSGTVSLGAIVVGEYTSPKYRGVFLYLKNATVCIGAMLVHILSQYLHWRTIALVALVPLFVALIIIYTWPESPAWLASTHQHERSEKIFYWLRGYNEDARKEFQAMIEAQEAKLSKLKSKVKCSERISDFFRKFRRRDFLKPFMIMVLATSVLEMSGRHVFPSYALQIMTAITGETTHSFYYALGIDIMITASALIALVLVKIMPRRTLLFSTGFAAVVILMLVSLYLFLISKGLIANGKMWISIALLISYFFLANFGCAPIPLALVGEVFPLAHRGVGSALSGIWISICLMAALKSTPHLMVNLGIHGLFAVNSSVMGISLFILYFILPETKDRTLQEIEYYFNHGKFPNAENEDTEANIKMIPD